VTGSGLGWCADTDVALVQSPSGQVKLTGLCRPIPAGLPQLFEPGQSSRNFFGAAAACSADAKRMTTTKVIKNVRAPDGSRNEAAPRRRARGLTSRIVGNSAGEAFRD
jgi:hypothetical protein